jgi:hypothetical protein
MPIIKKNISYCHTEAAAVVVEAAGVEEAVAEADQVAVFCLLAGAEHPLAAMDPYRFHRVEEAAGQETCPDKEWYCRKSF